MSPRSDVLDVLAASLRDEVELVDPSNRLPLDDARRILTALLARLPALLEEPPGGHDDPV